MSTPSPHRRRSGRAPSQRSPASIIATLRNPPRSPSIPSDEGLPLALRRDAEGTGPLCVSHAGLNHLCASDTPVGRTATRCVREPAACASPQAAAVASVAYTPTYESAAHQHAARDTLRGVALSWAVLDGLRTATDFAQLVQIDRVLDDAAKGASNTVVAFGTVRATGLPVACKIWLDVATSVDRIQASSDPRYGRNELLKAIMGAEDTMETMRKQSVEAGIYRDLTLGQGMPHVVRYIGRVHLKYPDAMFNLPNLTRAAREIRPEIPGEFLDGLHILLTELRPGVLRLHDIMTSPSFTPDSVRGLALQVLFALHMLTERGFQHNDMHTRNVLVDTRPDESGMLYDIGNTRFSVDFGASAGKVLLFDWDMGHCATCGISNTQVHEDFCGAYGICNTYNPRFDMYTVLQYMSSHLLDDHPDSPATTEFLGFVHDALDQQHPQTEKFQYRMCNPAKPPRWEACLPFPVGQPQGIMLPGQALMHPYFRPLRRAWKVEV